MFLLIFVFLFTSLFSFGNPSWHSITCRGRPWKRQEGNINAGIYRCGGGECCRIWKISFSFMFLVFCGFCFLPPPLPLHCFTQVHAAGTARVHLVSSGGGGEGNPAVSRRTLCLRLPPTAARSRRLYQTWCFVCCWACWVFCADRAFAFSRHGGLPVCAHEPFGFLLVCVLAIWWPLWVI